MYRTKLLAALAALAVGSMAHAGTVSRAAASHAVGADVTTAYSGVTVTRQRYTAGGGLLIEPTIISSCTTFGACALTAPMNTYGTNAHNLFGFRDCYNGLRLGFVSSQCRSPNEVLSIEFNTPTDFVEIEAVWSYDAPGLIAYDAAGNQLSQCLGAPCLSTVSFSSGEHLGVIRATAVSPVIKRVVFATPSGGSRARTIQYNTPSRWCLAPFPGP
jgi:hypothetical protein